MSATTVKAAIDAAITNQTADDSVSANTVGTQMKNIVDFADGVKVPAGGTAGQVLTKVDNTDNNTNWLTPSGGGGGYTLPVATPSVLGGVKQGANVTIDGDGTIHVAAPGGGGGYANRDFNAAVVFDAPFKSVYNQTADIAFSLGASPVADVDGRITITGDGVHSVTFPTAWVNASGQLFDNQQKNIIFFEYDGTEVLYSIVRVVVPDVIAPYIVSAAIANANKNKIVLQYSELLDTGSVPANGDFGVNLGKAVTAVAVTGSTVTLTVNSNYLSTDVVTVSYTPGGNPIQDPSANHAVALVNYAVTNNVAAARQSISIAAANQIQRTSVLPTNILWNGTGGGVDHPVSMSFWIKRNNTGSEYVMEMSDSTGADRPQWRVIVSNTGILEHTFYGSAGYGGSGYLDDFSTAAISANVWTHVVITSSGAGVSGAVKMYFNGALQALTNSANAYTALTSMDPATVLAILGRAGSATQSANIQLSSYYFWNKELSSTEVTALYNGGATIDPTTLAFAANLQARYEFNGDANDSSASGYNLTSSVAPTYTTDAP